MRVDATDATDSASSKGEDELQGIAVKMNFKRMRADATDATDSASSKGEDELQGIAVKMNFKRMRGRHNRRNRRHKLAR